MSDSANSATPGEITQLIGQWQEGNREAEGALFSALYDSLHKLAMRVVRSERQGQSLGPTALVHEAYLRLTRAEKIDLSGRSHFLALSARVMRRILVDRARARRAVKRDGVMVSAEWIDLVRTDEDADAILSVDLAMETLASDSPEQCQIVELRYFAGYSEEQCATILGTSTRTVRRRWQVARVRLKGLIDGTGTPA